MPIKPQNKHRYPANWPQIREAILKRAQHRCEACGARHNAVGNRLSTNQWADALPIGTRLGMPQYPKPGATAPCSDGRTRETLRLIRIAPTIAHLDRTPENCEPANLRAWCQRCHLAYDIPHHAEQRRRTRQQRGNVGAERQ